MAANSVTKVFQGLKKQLAQVVGLSPETDQVFLNGAGLSGTLLPTSKGDFLLTFMGENAYSQTFRAEPVEMPGQDHVLPRMALKRMHPQWLGKRSIQEHFKQEVDIVGGFLNPQLPRYQFKGELAFLPYYAYDYIEGVPLTHLLREKELYPPELVNAMSSELIVKILQQLRYLHQRINVVHGYVGLRSLLLSPEHDVSLIDFGCVYRKDRVIENDYRWVIDPRYCSPEQARQEHWDERSDLYQLGVVLYELLSAKVWNTGSTPEEQVAFAAELKPEDVGFFEQHASPAISIFLAELLHPDPEARLQSADICIERLESMMDG